MDFRIKVFLQKIMSYLPNFNLINYYFQKNIAKTLPVNNAHFLFYIKSLGFNHFNNFKKHCIDKQNARFFEFGAGQDLKLPLAYYYMGAPYQTLIDIVADYKFELINDSIQKFNHNLDQLSLNVNFQKERVIPKTINSLKDLKECFNIEIFAPIDARNTGFIKEQYDFISNTNTLEHIPSQDISPILDECYQILKPGGIMSCCIDLQDHYSYFDKQISYYNFLKYSPKKWEIFNSRVFAQNRLRYNDYLKIFSESKFSILEIEPLFPSEDDLILLGNIKIDPFFKNYNLKDLGVKTLWVVLKK